MLRGGVVEHERYVGRRVFGAGLNLTHLYRGEISYLFFPVRDLGLVHKVYRGLSEPRVEKLWIAAAETYAIGGACQLLLTTDHIIAEQTCRCTLPGAQRGDHPRRREPAAAALRRRPPRAPGDPLRLRAQARGAGRRDHPGRPDGRRARAPRGGRSRSAGAVSGVANRRALRIGQEPLDVFREYMSVVLARAGGLLLQPGADPQPRGELARP